MSVADFMLTLPSLFYLSPSLSLYVSLSRSVSLCLSLSLSLSPPIHSISDVPNAMSTWLKGDDFEQVWEENSIHGKKMFQSTAPMLQLPLVVDYYRLNQNTIGASVSHFSHMTVM